MSDDAQELIGTWTVKFMRWTWEYTFTADGRATWRDPLNNEKGAGRWALTEKSVNLSWTGSSTKEAWNRPIRPVDQSGWCSASYGNNVIKARKATPTRLPSNAPTFIKDPDTGMAGSKFTSAGQLWRQEIELGSSATVALENYSGMTVGLNNPRIAKLVTWHYGNLLYVDIVPTGVGDANLEGRAGDVVLAFIQINVSSKANGAIFVDDFAAAYYSIDYRHAGGNASKWIILEFRDSVVIDINIDQISDNPSKPNTGEGLIGAGGRRFPSQLDPLTTPRLYAAKKHAVGAMNANYTEFLESAKDGVFFILTINPIVAPLEQPTSIRPIQRRNLSRPVATHIEGGATAPTTSAPSATKIRPLNGQVSIGGGFENPNGSNLNPVKTGSGGPAKGIPNHVLGSMESMAEHFEQRSVEKMISSRLRYGDVDWTQGTKAAAQVMKSGGRVEMNVWTQSAAEQQALKQAFTSAGFKNVRVVQVGYDGTSTIVFADF